MIDRGPLWIWATIICILFVALYLVREILLPFIAGMAVAYFLDPILDRLEKCRLSRLMATIILTTSFFTLIIALITIMVPLLQGQVVSFVQKLPVMIDAFVQWLLPFQQELLNSIPKDQLPELGHLYKTFGGQIVKWGIGLAQGIFDGGVAIFNVISLIVITPIVCFYLLRDWDILVEKVYSWLPREYSDQIREILVEIDRTIARFVRGQMMVVALMGIMYAFGLFLCETPMSLSLGLMAGLFNLVPYLGLILGFAPAAILTFMHTQEWLPVLGVAGVFAFVQAMEGMIITPRVIGENIGLHPVAVIFAVLLGAELFGLVGMILGVPAVAILNVLFTRGILQYKNSPLYADQ